MSEGDGMAEVTEGDREKAVEVADAAEYRGRRVLENAIAAALAEEREKARAPFLALADHYLAGARRRGLPGGGDLAMVSAAIRRLAEEG